MKKLLLKTMIFVVLFLIPKIVFGNVVINEVLYNASGVDTGKEYIILYNNSDAAIDLTGYELNAVSGDYYVFPSFSLSAKSSIVIHWRKDGTNSSSDLYTGTAGFDANMGDTSGWVALFKNDQQTKDAIVDYLEYGAGGKTFESKAVDAGIWAAGNFIINAQEGRAIKLQTDGIDNNLPSDWAEATPSIISEETTPQEESASATQETAEPNTGTVNKPPAADAGDNIIGFTNQEIKFDGSNSSDPENNDLHYEWNMGNGKLIENPSFTYTYAYPGTYLITLMVFDGKNYSSDTITVKIQSAQIIINEFMANPEGKDEEEEWIEIYNDADSITDISSWQLDDIVSGSKPFTFPQNTLIAPKNYLVFSRQVTKIALNNDIDSVRLLLPDGTVFQEINYEKPPQGKSSARTNEGFVWSEPTPGMANIIGLSINGDKQTVSQISSVKPDVVKESSKGAIINLTESDIQGGYTNIGANDSKLSINTPDSSAGKFAGIKQSFQSPLNLALLIITIVFASGFVGLLLVKFRKRGLAP